MDKTANYYDLLYLAKHAAPTSEEQGITLNEDDFLFYKKRLLLLTTDFINGELSDDMEINEMFKLYAQTVIEYFKYNDTRDTIQQDYVEYEKKGEILKMNDLSGTVVDSLIMRKKVMLIPTMTNHVVITNVKKKSYNNSKNT